MLMTDDKIPGGCIKRADDHKEQFMLAWPFVSSWILQNFQAAILKRRNRRLLIKWWSIWVDEAAIFLPPLVSSSDSDEEA